MFNRDDTKPIPSPGIFQKVHLPHSCHAKQKEKVDKKKEKDKVKYMTWTNEMDSCLAKILVAQIKKGNKKDGILKHAAYMAAVSCINAKFALHLTKNHIKNRLKTWKKQFKILKELLMNEGFEWDEVQKMVVADNSVWNDHVKVHPDARQFRSKVIDNYDELCVIFSNDPQIAGSSDDNADIEVEYIGNYGSMGDANALKFQNDSKQSKELDWTEEMDCFLGEILAEEVRKGLKLNNILQGEGCETILSSLKERFSLELTKGHIQSRLRTWKKQYGILKKLLSHGGFKWDGIQRRIVAADSVWNDYVKAYPDARIFRAKVIENYDQLCLILENYNEASKAFDATPSQAVTLQDKVKNAMWTNEMDHYLSKILTEQVRMGNKSISENKLKPAAYVAAVYAMNERFQLELTKGHVKNRLKTWKEEYDNLKELLGNRDFEWDETRKMVVANDHAWDQYIKRNPDARQLQSWVINNYDELSIIFGCDDLPESSSRDGDFDFNFITESCAVDTFYNQSENTKEKGKYISWTDEMDRCLTELLLEQVQLGNKLDKSFKAAAYTAALAVLNKKFSLKLSKDNIRNRLKTWRKQYGLAKELLSHSGFEWDEKNKMVVASDIKWNEYIKKNPDARQLRAKSIENFNELRIIVGNEQASGNSSGTSAKDVVDHVQNNEDHAETPLEFLVNNEMSHDAADDGIRESSQQTRSRPSSSHSKQPYKRRRTDDVMVGLMSAIATNIGRIADALTEKSNNVCLDEVFEMVQAIPGFDDDLIIDACEYLSSEENRARMFVKLDERLRKKWLLKRLRGLGS